MLEPWIIDQIRRREEDRRRERPQLEIPAPGLERPRESDTKIGHDDWSDSAGERGVLIIGM